MEVILKKNVDKLGYSDDLVSVKPGYALNYLIPQGLAVIANDTNRRILAAGLRQKEKKEAKLLEQLSHIKATLESAKLVIHTKAGTTGKIFGSVTAYHIAEAIKKEVSIEVDRRKINIVGGEVKELGAYSAEVGLGKEHKVAVQFEVVAE